MATPVTTLLHVEYARLVTLYMSKLKFIIRENVNHTVPTSNLTDVMMAQVLYPCFGIVVDKHSHVRNAKVLRQEVLIVVVAV